jgi:shikimate kinase
MKLDKNQFRALVNKRITLLGMSGVGKTHLAKLIGQAGDWFHFSGDYHIGATHLKDEIVDNIALKMKKDPLLKTLLNNHSISVNSQVTFDNLEPISAFLGKVGNHEEGGLPIDEFARRQALFMAAETKAMYDVPAFIERALNQGQEHFINDAGGSLCELTDNRVYETLSEHTLILYIKTSSANEKMLIERAQQRPKPLYYQTEFLQSALNEYLNENKLSYVAQISPDAFVRWVFPRLVANRLPKYQAIADQYGYTLNSDDLYQCKTADDVFNLIDEALD